MKTAQYLGSSLTHSLTHSLTDGLRNIWAECHNSVIFQYRDFKFSPKILKNYVFMFLEKNEFFEKKTHTTFLRFLTIL